MNNNYQRIMMIMVFGLGVTMTAPAASLTNADYWVSVTNTNAGGDTNSWACPTNCGAVTNYEYDIMQCEVTVTQYCEFPGCASVTNNYPNGTGLEHQNPIQFANFSNAMVFADWLTTNTPVVFTTPVKCTDTNSAVITNVVIYTNCYVGVYAQVSFNITNLTNHVGLTNYAIYQTNSPPNTNYFINTQLTNTNYTYTFILTSSKWTNWNFWTKTSTNHVYVLPTEDEWYKAAYYTNNPDQYFRYPNHTNAAPTNNTDFNFSGGTTNNQICAVSNRVEVTSSYGTYDQGGNVWEWIEPNTNATPRTPDGMAIIRGGSYFSRHPRDLSSSVREFHAADNAVAGIGFRLIRILQP